jgi:hypothetical protein
MAYGKVINRGMTNEEIAKHITEDGWLEVPVHLFSLAQEISKNKATKDFMPPLRGDQTGKSDSRKGDLAMNALVTLMTNGITYKDKKGVEHKLEIDVEKQDVPGTGVYGDKQQQFPREVVLGSMPSKKSGKAAYTVEKYANEKPAWTPKTEEELKADRNVAVTSNRLLSKLKGRSYDWKLAMEKQLADGKFSDTEAKAFAKMLGQRQRMLTEEVENLLLERGVSQDDIDEQGVWAFVEDKKKNPDGAFVVSEKEKYALYDKTAKEVHQVVLKRNLRAAVKKDFEIIQEELDEMANATAYRAAATTPR